MIDLAVLAVLAVFGFFGLLSGAIRQVGHLGGLAAGYLLARPLGHLVGPTAAARLGYPVVLTNIVASLVAFFLVYLAAAYALRFLLAKLLPDGERGGLNRAAGFALGAAKAAAVLLVMLSIALLAEKPLVSLLPAWRREARTSVAVSLARRYSPFTHLPTFAGLERLSRAARDPAAAARLAQDPDFKALSRDPRVQQLSKDAAVQKALETGDWASALGSASLHEALDDAQVRERLGRLSSAAE